MRTPDVVYIGQQKTGSTFLRSYFTQHPEIAWTRHAPMFQLDPFVGPAYLEKFAEQPEASCVVDMYEGLAVGYHLGEAPEWRAADALVPGAPLNDRVMVADQRQIATRIRSVLPEARILLTFRNQVAWLKSNYLHYMLSMPPKRRRFGDFLQTREGRLLLAAGDYSQIVDLYRELFGADRVHVVLLEDIVAGEAEVLRQLCAFLKVPYVPFDASEREYNTGIGAGRGALVRLYSRLGISDEMARRLRPLARPVERLAAGWVKAPTLTESEEAMLRDFYAVANYRLARQFGRDLSALGYTC